MATNLERKLSEATKLLEDALRRLEGGEANYGEVQELEHTVDNLYRQQEENHED